MLMYYDTLTAFTLLVLWLSFVFVLARIKLNWALLTPLLFTPLYLLRFHIFSIPSTALELTIYTLAGATLFGLIEKHRKQPLKAYLSFNNLAVLGLGVLWLGLGLGLATLFSPDIRTSLGIVKGWFFDPALYGLILITAGAYLMPPDKAASLPRQLLKALFWGGALAALAALYSAAKGEFSFDGRLYGFYDSPNQLAMLLVPAFLSGSIYLGDKLSLLKAKLLAMTVTVYGTALLLSFSLGGWASVLAGGIVFLLTAPVKQRLKLKALVAIGLGLVLAISALLLTFDSGKLAAYVDNPERSPLASRLIIWQVAWQLGLERPLVGIGPGMFQEKYLDRQESFRPYLEWASPQPHNLFLAFWLQTGILGLAGFLIILAWLFKTNYSQKKRRIMLEGSVVIAVLSAILIHGLIDTTYWKNDLSLIFWLLVAITIINQSANLKMQNDKFFFDPET